MPEYLLVELIMAVLVAVFSVLWWLLRLKDYAQSKQIDTLVIKHDEDVERLNQLTREIDRNHYVKPELDIKFEQLTNSVNGAIDKLGLKVDRMTNALLSRNEPPN